MAKMPGVTFAPLAKEQGQRRMLGHDIACIHTAVGSLTGTDGYFRQGGWKGPESHYGTGGYGEILQWQDTDYSADANLDGWGSVISIENADMGAPFPAWNTRDGGAVPAFTDLQMDANARILAWECSVEAHAECPATWTCHQQGIPLGLIPDTKPGRRGVGYHAQGVPGNGLVPGGVAWSSARGKVCPGRRRIAQIPLIIARARDLAGVPALSVEDDVTPAQAAQLDEILLRQQTMPDDVWNRPRITYGPIVDQPPYALLATAMTGALGAAEGSDPGAIAQGLADQLGPDLARQVLAALSDKLAQ